MTLSFEKPISTVSPSERNKNRGGFSKAMKDLLIDNNGVKAKKIIKLENALRAVESENAILKTRIDILQKELTQLKQDVPELIKEALENRLREIKRTIPELEESDRFLERDGYDR